jgi:hypothetical protein
MTALLWFSSFGILKKLYFELKWMMNSRMTLRMQIRKGVSKTGMFSLLLSVTH